MTINRDWLCLCKKLCPAAFTDHSTFSQHFTVFIDGQIRLMKADAITTWPQYVHCQFASFIRKQYAAGARRVVLAFDDYGHVPLAKSMTQQRRMQRSSVTRVDVPEDAPLPLQVPGAELWAGMIMNRTFKSKVIHYVIATILRDLAHIMSQHHEQSLVIDYYGTPKEYTLKADSENGYTLHAVELETLLPLGEADVKFTRYASSQAPLMVDAVDGDYVPIALLCTESAVEHEPNIEIRRLKMHVDATDEKRAGKARVYEFVNIRLLRKKMASELNRRTGLPRHRAMQLLAFLIGLTGTDFSRGLPLLGARFIWAHVADGRPRHIKHIISENTENGTPTIDKAAAIAFIAELYEDKFKKHCSPCRQYKDLYNNLQSSKLATRTRDMIPKPHAVDVTARNITWVLHYWSCENSEYEDPVDPRYGYVHRTQSTGARVAFEDQAEAR